jgi:hypothetical protein
MCSWLLLLAIAACAASELLPVLLRVLLRALLPVLLQLAHLV